MALLLKTIYKGYNWIFTDLADTRVLDLDLFLMASPIKPALIVIFYFYFTFTLGPKLMEKRKPFDLKNVLIVYNALQIILNVYIVYEAILETFSISWDCEPIGYNVDPKSIKLLKIYHFFFLVKATDLLDTVFFVLRKRYKQISFLHVYHHFGMFLMIWVAVKFFGGGAGVFVGLINGAVHAVMYTYYLLTALDDKWKNSIIFKRSLTQMQIVQFIIFIVIYGRLLFKPDCEYPKICSFFFVPQNCFMLALFGDFYRRTYLKRKDVEAKPTRIEEGGKHVLNQDIKDKQL